MNERCHAPVRKLDRRATTWWAKVANGTALDKLTDLDVLLPCQYLPASAQSPERMLLTEVLVGAFTDLAHRRLSAIEEIETWLSEGDRHSTARISFPRLCRFLDLDEGEIRRGLERGIEAAKERGGV
jgi:hypothetical protein